MEKNKNSFIPKTLVMIIIFMILCSVTFSQSQIRKTYYPSKKIKLIEYINANKKTRIIYYFENGKKMQESNFDKHGNLFGKQLEYYETGLTKKETFIIGTQSIPYSFISDTANIDMFVDVVTFKVTNFYGNGMKKSEGFVVNGMRSGYWLFYNEKGHIIKSEFYKCLTKDE